jgi:hypothetical protein
MARDVTKRTQSDALVADYLVRVALAGRQVFAEGHHAIKPFTAQPDPGSAAYNIFMTCSMEGDSFASTEIMSRGQYHTTFRI